MRFNTRARRRVKAFELTPMIDIVLQLIIFFLFTSQFSEQSRSPIDLPREEGERASAGAPDLIVDIDETGAYLVEGRPVSLGDIDRMLARLGAVTDEGPSVQVRPDRASRSAHLNELLRLLASRGVTRWTMGTSRPPQGGS